MRVVVEDEAGYGRYFQEGSSVRIEDHGGRILAYDPEPEVVEGEGFGAGARAVILEFETEEGFRAWYDSDGYQKALVHRLAATTSNAILARQRPVQLESS